MLDSFELEARLLKADEILASLIDELLRLVAVLTALEARLLIIGAGVEEGAG